MKTYVSYSYSRFDCKLNAFDLHGPSFVSNFILYKSAFMDL